MENTKANSTNAAFKWTMIYIIASIVLTYIIQFSGIDINSPLKYVNYLLFIGFMLMAQKEYRDQLGGFMSFGQGFMSGFMYSVFSAIFSAIFVYVYLTILYPQGLEQIVAAAQAKMQEQGNLSSDQMDTAINMTKKYGVIFGSIGTLFGLLIMGSIVALIGAAVFKKEPSLLDIEKAADSYNDPSV